MDDVIVLPVVPWTGAALLVVLLVALNVPAPVARPALLRTGGSVLAGRITSVVALAVVAALAVVGRVGTDSQLDNPVPALVVGLGWPALFVLPPVVGLALRNRLPAEAGDAPRDVRPSVAAAAAVVGYLVLVPRATSPEVLATALAGYAVVLLAVGIAGGRSAAARVEVVGLLVRWGALATALVRWHPPRGAAAVVCVVLGGAWAERAQRTSAWAEAGYARPGQVALLVAAVALAGVAALALTSWSDGRAAPVLLPLAAAAVVAGVLRRSLISAQLLWDQSGLGHPGLSPDPLGIAGGQAAALAVTTLGGALAAAVLARRVGAGPARLPGAGVVLAVTAVTAWAVLSP